MYTYIYHISIASTQFDTEYIGFDSSLQQKYEHHDKEGGKYRVYFVASKK